MLFGHFCDYSGLQEKYHKLHHVLDVYMFGSDCDRGWCSFKSVRGKWRWALKSVSFHVCSRAADTETRVGRRRDPLTAILIISSNFDLAAKFPGRLAVAFALRSSAVHLELGCPTWHVCGLADTNGGIFSRQVCFRSFASGAEALRLERLF